MRQPMTLAPQGFHPALHERQRMSIPLIVQLLKALRRKLQLHCHASNLADDLRCVSKSAIPPRGQYTIAAVRQLIESSERPPNPYTPRCKGCSLYDVCLPKETKRLRGDPRVTKKARTSSSVRQSQPTIER